MLLLTLVALTPVVPPSHADDCQTRYVALLPGATLFRTTITSTITITIPAAAATNTTTTTTTTSDPTRPKSHYHTEKDHHTDSYDYHYDPLHRKPLAGLATADSEPAPERPHLPGEG